jgi:hypothetical protein
VTFFLFAEVRFVNRGKKFDDIIMIKEKFQTRLMEVRNGGLA